MRSKTFADIVEQGGAGKTFTLALKMLQNLVVCVCMLKTLKIYPLSKFQVYDTRIILLTIVTMLCIRSLELTHLV